MYPRGTCFSSLTQASAKKSMIKDGTLDKYGRPNEKTPPDWEKKLFSSEKGPGAVTPAPQVGPW